MKQTVKIEIEVPEGCKAVYNEDTQKVEIVKIELPKTWEEFCENNPIKNWECFITERSKIEDFYTEDSVTIPEEKRVRNVYTDKSTLPDRETAEAFLALMQLIQLRDCYRQGWKPDWDESNYKATITYGRYGVNRDYSYWKNQVLSFPSNKIRDEFLVNFSELIEKAKELI